MYYSDVEIEYLATSFSPARMDLAVKLLTMNVILMLIVWGGVDARGPYLASKNLSIIAP